MDVMISLRLISICLLFKITLL
jgi:hypothetical protein